jgi:FdrA protein
MPITGTLVHGKYLDSVKLMLISKEIRKQDGVFDAVAIMATKENKAILKATDMLLPEFESALETDICIAINAETDALCSESLDLVKLWLDKGLPSAAAQSGTDFLPRSIDGAFKQMPDANLALISVAGKYAGAEAKKALDIGLNVMLFSDNVSISIEKSLKEYAVSHNLLMMGPDCGTAIINGIPLAFANAVRRGKIGIVSAAGTGLQEVSSIIHNNGEGISQAFGTGGRDGKKEIGGLMLLFCLGHLINDPDTEVIVLICKVPDSEVITKLWNLIKTTPKPVVVNFLKPFDQPALDNVYPTATLAETAKKACRLLHDKNDAQQPQSNAGNDSLFPNRTLITLPTKASRKYLRGLFSGGTLCYEAQSLYHKKLGGYAYSNAPLEKSFLLNDVWQSREDTIVDLGADEFTVGRPHPMIDYSLRIKKIEEESKDETTAIILLDVVLGYGAHLTPHLELAPVLKNIKANTCIIVLCSVVGTDNDPQNRQSVIKALQDAEAVVTTTNAEACELAMRLLQSIRNK